MQEFPELPEMRVVDLGGTALFWEGVPTKPLHVTTLNISDPYTSDAGWITQLNGDACTDKAPGTFDLVFSNSLIEHVGGHWRRSRLADEVHRLADRHWVQTPYRFFPVEPHWMAPGMQWLPVPARAALTQRWPLGHIHADSYEEGLREAMEIELLTVSEMRHYFPTSRIWYERFGGLVKSLVAIKS
jgi:hypothetical protein